MALVRLTPPPTYRDRVICFSGVPRLAGFAGVLVRCRDVRDVNDILGRIEASGSAAAHVAVGLVIPKDYDLARAVASRAIPIEPLLFTDDLHGDRPPTAALDVLSRRTAVQRLCREAEQRLVVRPSPEQSDIVVRLIEAGARGHGIRFAARKLGMSPATLRRWCSRWGLGSPGRLLTTSRIYVARRLLESGVHLARVAELGGWTSVRACRMALRRARDKQIGHSLAADGTAVWSGS